MNFTRIIHHIWCICQYITSGVIYFHQVMYLKEYWEILRELREDRDLTQGEIAAHLNTTQQVYSRYEKGINEMPIRHLITLCKLYSVSADYVLGLAPAENTRNELINSYKTKEADA